MLAFSYMQGALPFPTYLSYGHRNSWLSTLAQACLISGSSPVKAVIWRCSYLCTTSGGSLAAEPGLVRNNCHCSAREDQVWRRIDQPFCEVGNSKLEC